MGFNKKTTTAPTTKKTTFSVSSPVEWTDKEGKNQTFWQDVGKGFETKDGIMVSLNALPVNGKLYIREFQPREAIQK